MASNCYAVTIRQGSPQLLSRVRSQWCSFSQPPVHVLNHMFTRTLFQLCASICLSLQAKEHLMSMLVWHERLLYGDNQEGASSVQQFTDHITRLGSGFKNLLSRNK